MIHAGIGNTHVNAFLTALGIPEIHHKTLKKMERLVGPIIESAAKDSCNRASLLEKSISLEKCDVKTEIAPEVSDEQITFEEAMQILEDDGGNLNSTLKCLRFTKLI